MVFGGNDPEPKKITRADEPEEYFASDFESASVDEKLKDPLVIIGSSTASPPVSLLLLFSTLALPPSQDRVDLLPLCAAGDLQRRRPRRVSAKCARDRMSSEGRRSAAPPGWNSRGLAGSPL